MKQAACVFLFSMKTRQVALVTRKNSTEVGLPGGKVDPGETPVMAAQRELFEETGVKVSLTDDDMFFRAICPGDVEYDTFCYFKRYDDDLPSFVAEEGTEVKFGDFRELLTNSPFVEYNRQMLFELYLQCKWAT